MENFLFSVQATIPVFVVILAGWCLRRVNILNDSFVNAADRFCFQVAIPILLFQDISGTEMADLLDWHFIGFCFMATTVCFGVIWLISRLVMKDKSLVGAFVQGSSIELSADGPIRPPYAVYFQGGLTWYHAKLGILMSLQKLYEAELIKL